MPPIIPAKRDCNKQNDIKFACITKFHINSSKGLRQASLCPRGRFPRFQVFGYKCGKIMANLPSCQESKSNWFKVFESDSNQIQSFKYWLVKTKY